MKDDYTRDHCLHFAYGATLHPDQIHARCEKPTLVAVARLKDYRLEFFGHSKVWDSGMETVVPAVGQEVWGAVYSLRRSDADRLDTLQDVRLDGTGNYFQYPVQVTDTEGNVLHVLLYKKDILGTPTLPSREYLDLIVLGAQKRGLPEDYITQLKKHPSVAASYAVPRLAKFDRSMLLETACECGDLRKSKGGPGLVPTGENDNE
ncbi:MAG TPA: gamma-glutamylcyclotransferase family protein [Fibrobacteraceae bacterium]|nr:gamma-glutamylcyclotransferase family protein [Fibrobacteraceae bacterium]